MERRRSAIRPRQRGVEGRQLPLRPRGQRRRVDLGPKGSELALEFALLAADVGQSELASLACRLNALAAKSPLSALNGGPSRPIFRSAVDIVDNPACEVVDPEEMLHRARTAVEHPVHDGAVTAAS